MVALDPLTCSRCGAGLPLADGDRATCPSCAATTVLPEEYRALRAAGRAARELRERAEAAYQALFGHVPRRGALAVYSLFVVAVCVAVPVAMGLSPVSFGPRVWVVLGGLLPFAVSFFYWPVLWVRANAGVYLAALGRRLASATHDPGSGAFACGRCGAPLAVAPDALAATCDYCHADSWVDQRLAPDGRAPRAEVIHAHSANKLADLVATAQFQQLDLRVYGVTWVIVWAIALSALWFALPASLPTPS